jgi:hypothetical protein
MPRLKPREFYELVVEVAIVRPGPLQGGMVHPYLKRRASKEPATPPHPCLESILLRRRGSRRREHGRLPQMMAAIRPRTWTDRAIRIPERLTRSMSRAAAASSRAIGGRS